MSKEYNLVDGLPAVPLIGIVAISLRAGELAAFPWVHTALPRSSGAAANAAAISDVRQKLAAALPGATIDILPRIGFSAGLQTIPTGEDLITLWIYVNHRFRHRFAIFWPRRWEGGAGDENPVISAILGASI
jgi:hypothetical protein